MVRMRGETSKLGRQWVDIQGNQYEMRNNFSMVRMRGETG